MKLITILTILASLPPAAAAQTRERGPWWPHPIWGPDDHAGGSNWITPDKVLSAIRLVRTGKIYELGHIYDRDMPLGMGRTYSLTIPGSPTFGPWGRNQLVVHDDFLVATIGQVGTQFDGPGHVVPGARRGSRLRVSLRVHAGPIPRSLGIAWETACDSVMVASEIGNRKSEIGNRETGDRESGTANWDRGDS